jgi:hypothetical protein
MVSHFREGVAACAVHTGGAPARRLLVEPVVAADATADASSLDVNAAATPQNTCPPPGALTTGH